MPTDGKKLDNRYAVRKEIGSGGFGAVYLAEDTRFIGKNLVAIKKMPQGSEQSTKSFRNEANLLYNLTHPNLPKVTNCFQENEANYIVMNYIAGEDLMQRLKKGASFSIAEVLEIADKILGALEYLHSFSIYHRDIKPHNIKIDEHGKIYLLDFGTAKGQMDDATVSLTEQQSVTGYTPSYAPLEQVLRVDANSYLLLRSINTRHLDVFEHYKTDARSDVYGLGATVYHLLTNTSPDRATATLRAHLLWSGKPDPLVDCRRYNPKISERLAAVIKKALEIDPSNRFQTAAEFRAALAGIASADFAAEKPPARLAASPISLNTAAPPNQATQPSGEPFKVDVQRNAAPDASVQTLINKPASPKSRGKFAVIFAGAFLLIAAAVGAAGWLAWKSFSPPPTAANANRQIAAPNAAQTNALSYSLLVQKMRDGKKYQEPFESSGQEIFENGYQFQIRLIAPANGFLYVFAEGLNERGEKVLSINFPTPQRNDGKSAVTANQHYESGWNEFGGKPGTENYWLIFVSEESEIVEQARKNAFAGNGKITDKEMGRKLKSFLDAARNNRANSVKDTENKLTRIIYEGDSIIYLIGLEHR